MDDFAVLACPSHIATGTKAHSSTNTVETSEDQNESCSGIAAVAVRLESKIAKRDW